MRRAIYPRLPFVVAVLLLTSVPLSSPASAQGQTGAGPARFDEQAPLPAAQGEGRPGNPDRHPKMSSQLAATNRIARESGEGAALQGARDRNLAVRDNRVRVVIEAGDSAAATAVVEQARGTVERAAPGLLLALVPVGALDAVASQPSVRYVRPPARPVPLAVQGEGPADTGANTWVNAGTNGAGVKVAIIDVAFAGYTARQASGDLPNNLVTKEDFCSPGTFATGSGHGTAVAEIVYEMAPGAQLYLVCVETEVDLVNAKDWVKSQGITIINHSVSWFGLNRGDGSGPPSSPNGVVADARAGGILWVNAAGNSGHRHWSGSWVDANGNGFLDFKPTDEGQTVFISNGAKACFVLTWDAWPGTDQDFDMALYRSNALSSPAVASSINDQLGTQPPEEDLCYTNSTGTSQNFAILISKFRATQTPRFDLWSLDVDLEYQTPEGSIEDPASSPNVLAAGAVCWQSNALEPYSSEGPTIDGRAKPELVAPDAVSSATYGPFSQCGSSAFAGTSASAPHVVGAAALVKEAFPSITAGQLQNFLTGHAIDQGPSGIDNLYGAGRLSLGAPPAPQSVVGGRDFTLLRTPTGAASMTWAGGAVQSGYMVIRWSSTNGTTFLPHNFQPLAASATSFVDTDPLSDPTYCYLVMPVGGNPANPTSFLGFSDFLCIYTTGATGNMPTNVSVQLKQGTTTTLTWTAPGGQTGYDLVVSTFTGSGPTTIPLTGDQTTTTHETGGVTTCYELRAKSGPAVIGVATKVCAVPGIYATATSTRSGSTSPAPGVQRAITRP